MRKRASIKSKKAAAHLTSTAETNPVVPTIPPPQDQSGFSQIGPAELLNSLADAAYVTDLDRKIVFWSHAAERLTGWSAEEVVNHHCSDNILVHVDKDGNPLCGHIHCPLHRAMVTGETSGQPLLLFAQHRQGHRVPLQVSVAPLRDATGHTIGGVEVFRDLTSGLKELARAKMIQEHSLESRLPKDPRVFFDVRYVPEELVGGDFYRVESLDNETYAVLVADVMGHGIASALYTMQLRSLWEECRAQLTTPAQFMTELNFRLHTLISPEGYFATAVYILLNAATGKLRCVRAGHPSPMLVRAAGTIERLDHRSPALGLDCDSVFVESEARLCAGDTLLLFTDGALELVNEQGEELGEQGLTRIISQLGPASMDLRQIEKQLLEFTNLIHFADDLTLLSIRRST